MKKKLILIVFLAYNTLMFSQEKDSLLVGEWKVICIETHNYYYNSITDSLSYSKEFKKMLPDLIKSNSFGFKNIEDFNEQAKKEISNDKFIFEENEVYLRKKDDKIISEANYKIDTSKKTILFKDKNKPEYTMEYSIEKEFLHLTRNYKGGIKTKSKTIYLKPTIFILKRI
ncbi:MAG: hypothetical protein V4572_10255 [Bacteroidota bacterium]